MKRYICRQNCRIWKLLLEIIIIIVLHESIFFDTNFGKRLKRHNDLIIFQFGDRKSFELKCKFFSSRFTQYHSILVIQSVTLDHVRASMKKRPLSYFAEIAAISSRRGGK